MDSENLQTIALDGQAFWREMEDKGVDCAALFTAMIADHTIGRMYGAARSPDRMTALYEAGGLADATAGYIDALIKRIGHERAEAAIAYAAGLSAGERAIKRSLAEVQGMARRLITERNNEIRRNG